MGDARPSPQVLRRRGVAASSTARAGRCPRLPTVHALPADLRLGPARTRTLVRLKCRDEDGGLSASAMMTLATMLEAKSRYAEGHCQRAANYAAALGRRIGLGEDELETLRRGAFLHDIGMLAMPDTVLLKWAPLDPDEVALIQSHPVIGESLIAPLPSLQPSGVIVRQHHERRDGSGYPDGLQGDEISLLAQIVGLVDIFEALTASRPYQDAVSPREALDLLRRQARLGLHRRDLLDEFADLVHAT